MNKLGELINIVNNKDNFGRDLLSDVSLDRHLHECFSQVGTDEDLLELLTEIEESGLSIFSLAQSYFRYFVKSRKV